MDDDISFSDEGFSDDSDQPQTVEDAMAALKALKAKKKVETEKKSEKKPKNKRIISDYDRELIKRDEEDMDFYAKKLGLKDGKLSTQGDDDGLGGLLDGLNFDFSSEEEIEESEEESEALPWSDDELSEGDFDSEDDESEEEGPRVKENPYVAPVVRATEPTATEGETSRYIPPALRRQMLVNTSDTTQLRRAIKGPLNRLGESNISTISNEVHQLYHDNPRQVVNECITDIVLDSIISQGRLLDNFVILHAALVASLFRLQGVEFGAFFIQTLVERFDKYYAGAVANGAGKECSNLLSLLVGCYSLQVVSCRLLYDMIRMLISEITELNTELLLRLIKNAGSQMRSDDPGALKEIIADLQSAVGEAGVGATNARTKFLVETVINLKNNKMKTNESQPLVTRMKKYLAGINNNKFNDPIAVSLDDIHSIGSRGKWWLVGSAWKGAEKRDADVATAPLEVQDILDTAEPNWMALARAQRMNTDIRRAIFISIMSASDYMDAVAKLDKLNLTKNQKREVPRVLLHCTGVEPSWNPYYGVLSVKLCDDHSTRKTFQFAFWNLVAELDGDDEDEDKFDDADLDDDAKLRRILNLARFYGFLFSEGALSLHILDDIKFVGASSDTTIFAELLLITFLDMVGKKSEIPAVGGGAHKSKMHDVRYDETLLIQKLVKCKDRTRLLRAMPWFLQEKVRASATINGKKQRRRVEWGCDAMCDVIEEFLKNTEED
ncbi:hypothetical protein BABINDRAFT_38077 [Babjeviella inositovora NRRL Y-12698]|uniref:MI domain-containing protein n=1 Tax=Babjeviella inositovora NRRL Y-12698 TaxID=984486 RepID=A0A1E3QQ14_9ASCO|nr:uncharacterized protein BABINDRAFT_38077 [Babjeviella inositovora NRRL Y-12698]ODQ79162.1 hypothetical protein BABINDRAFT_38077 [Babjeviella inositovora NRRL Y-12698]